MKYFAYGVNMNHAGMKQRCPDSTFIGPATLHGYTLIFDGRSRLRPGATANIRVAADDVVWGGLYEISEQDLSSLDDFEGEQYRREVFTVYLHDAEEKVVDAVIFYRRGELEGPPGAEYLRDVIQGARDCNLPKDYIDQIARIRASVQRASGKHRF